MTIVSQPIWEAKRTDETREVEDALRNHFEQVDSYRYNCASIRVRVIDSRFEGQSRDKRIDAVETWISQLPEDTQRDIVTLFCFAPSELENVSKNLREFILNTEFDNPSRSML